MTIRLKLTCSFTLIALLVGVVSYVSLRSARTGDSMFATGAATILSLEDVRSAGLRIVTAAREAGRVTAKKATSQVDVAEEGATILTKKEELKKAEAAFLEAVNDAIQNERRRLADNKRQTDSVAAGPQKNIVLISVLMFLTVLTIGIYTVSFVSQSFTVLTRAAVEVSKGRFDESLENTIRLELGSRGVLLRDEIAVLAGAFTTMFKQLQDSRAQLERYQQDLETQVTQRTLTLRQAVDQAQDAAQQAESAHCSKLQCLAAMNHELYPPVNKVLGMTELLLDTPLSAQQRRFAEAVYHSGKSLLSLIDDLLDFSKIEAGKLELEAIDFELRPFVEDLAGLYAERAQKKGLELVYQIADDAPATVQGDPHRLRQILTSLVAHAITFTEKGEVVIEVKSQKSKVKSQTDDSGSHDLRPETCDVFFSVRDTGIGISPEVQQHLFQSFTQTDGSVTRAYGGTDPGLVIAKQLVQLMGGKIGLSSSPGVGSTFWFTVRLTERPPLAPALTGLRLQGWRVLIVDDNAANRTILQQQCVAWGMHGAEAENGAQALAKLHAGAQSGALYTVALLDLHLPGMDGLQLAQAIKADPAIASVRLLMLTSIGDDEDIHEAQRAGIEACLSKPVRQADLYRALTTLPASYDA
ncbi:MAG: response regulator, partial [Deltaproteobacteria bacterium]|nr:response regulator [Deltaproteobacteria bacterium]